MGAQAGQLEFSSREREMNRIQMLRHFAVAVLSAAVSAVYPDYSSARDPARIGREMADIYAKQKAAGKWK
jgi:hypothetical protein